MNEKIFNGSQKHILEWISYENFLESFNNLMSDAKVSINTKEYLKPKSLNDYKEYNISSYCKENYKKFEFLKISSFSFFMEASFAFFNNVGLVIFNNS